MGSETAHDLIAVLLVKLLRMLDNEQQKVTDYIRNICKEKHC